MRSAKLTNATSRCAARITRADPPEEGQAIPSPRHWVLDPVTRSTFGILDKVNKFLGNSFAHHALIFQYNLTPHYGGYSYENAFVRGRSSGDTGVGCSGVRAGCWRQPACKSGHHLGEGWRIRLWPDGTMLRCTRLWTGARCLRQCSCVLNISGAHSHRERTCHLQAPSPVHVTSVISADSARNAAGVHDRRLHATPSDAWAHS